MMKTFWRSLAFILALFVCITLAWSPAQAADRLEVGALPQGSASLTRYFDVLEDPSGALTLADVRRPDVAARFRSGFPENAALNFGNTRSTYWLRLSLRNDGDRPVERMLEISYSRLTLVELHQPLSAGGYEATVTGCIAPFASRPYPNRYFVFPLTLPPHAEQTYYLRVAASSALMVPARLWTPEAFHTHERNDYAAQAWYFGIATAMILFNLLLFVALKDRIYLIYVGFVAAMAFTLAAHQGLVKEFVAADSLAWSLSGASIGYALTVGLLMLFMRHMLNTWLLLPRFDRLLRIMGGFYLLPLPLILMAAHQSVIWYSQLLSLSMMLLIMGTAVYGAFKRVRAAYFFIAAYVVLFFASSMTGFIGLGWLPASFDTSVAIQLGSAAEMLLLAFALADRFNQMRLEKQKAQESAASAQAQLVETLRTSERALENRVAQRTAELRQFIDMLSHEIKTPMSVIRMCLGMEAPSVGTKRHAQQAIQDIDAIIERCLQADRLDHSAVHLRRQLCDVEAMVDALRSSSNEPERIVARCSGKPVLETDLQLLNVVLSNLIDNALKYAAPQSTVLVDIENATAEGKEGMRLGIANSPGAAGMPEVDRVFEKYYRSPGAHGKSGSGLGLYLVRRIVELLGGTIRYRPSESEVRFELWMPR